MNKGLTERLWIAAHALGSGPDCDLMEEAAKEITALQAEVEAMKADQKVCDAEYDECLEHKEALQAENEQRCNEYNELTMRYAKAIARAEAAEAEVERLKRMNADQDSLLETRTDELEAAEAKAESIRCATIEACAEVADKRYFAFHAAADIRALARSPLSKRLKP